MNYRVLWIDDEFALQKDFIGAAEQEGIDIYPFPSHEEGIAALEKDLAFYNGVILDAKVKKGKNDVVTGLAGLTASRDRLIELNKEYNLPYFIFTGQPDYVDAGFFKETYGKYYVKGRDNSQLFEDIKDQIEHKVEYKVQKKYQKVFEACHDNYVGRDASKYLMDILMNLEKEKDLFDDEKNFNGLRKVIELVFRAANRKGLLHEKCIPGGIVNLTWSSLFMSQKEVELGQGGEKIGCEKVHFPSILASNIKSILAVTNGASHTEDERETGKLNFSLYKKGIPSNYLLYSLTFQVMDILVWIKNYFDQNPETDKNRSLWLPRAQELGAWQTGKVINVNAERGFGFFKPDAGATNTFIPDYLIRANFVIDKDRVSVTIEEYQDVKTGQTKTRVKELRKLDK